MRSRTRVRAGRLEVAEREYDLAAPCYRVWRVPRELVLVRRMRSRLLARARGDVLEVAAGPGENLARYPLGCRVTATDLSAGMLAAARRRLRRGGVRLLRMDAHALRFPGASFDTVVSAFSLCSLPDPLGALQEMRRVCRPDGRVLLLQHGASDREWIRRLQDLRAIWWTGRRGCRGNRRHLDLLRRADLEVVAVRRSLLGVFYEIEARPSPTAHGELDDATG